MAARSNELEERRRRIEGDGRPRIAIAEDDNDIRSALAAMFALEGFEVSSLANGDHFMEHLDRCRLERRVPHVILLDHRLPGRCGLEILESINGLGWETPVIVMTAFGEEVTAPARRLGARAIFTKPFEAEDLQTAVRYWSGVSPPARRVPQAWAWNVAPTCASCGSSVEVHCEPRVPGVTFCAECWERAAPPNALDELGVGD